ncbi:MAG: hypothetical protein HYZ28_16570 [Myxococcales bacterium]|nr:hypothetical protein [Myxococcales bacterium]
MGSEFAGTEGDGLCCDGDLDFDSQVESNLWRRALDGEPEALRALAESLEPIDEREVGVGD